MNRNSITYTFHEVSACNMCGASSQESRILGQRLNKSLGLRPKKRHGIAVSVMRCESCGLIYSNPLPVPEHIEDHYGIPPDEYWNNAETEPDENYFSGQIQKAKELLGDDQAKRTALDIGVGHGQSMCALNRAGFDAFGLEPSSPFRDFAIKTFGLDPERLKLGMVEDAEYPENFFDFITFGAVLEHLYDPAEAIARAMKWLKPGGVIQIEVPSSNHLIARLINFYYRLIGTNYVTNLSPMHSPFHLYEFDLNSFAKHAERLGYDVTEHHFYVCEIYHFPKLIHPLLRSLMKRNNSGMQLEVWLRKRS